MRHFIWHHIHVKCLLGSRSVLVSNEIERYLPIQSNEVNAFWWMNVDEWSDQLLVPASFLHQTAKNRHVVWFDEGLLDPVP